MGQSGHFTVDVDVDALHAAQTRLAGIGRQLEEEGAKLARMPDRAHDWTGRHAETLKRATELVAADMRAAATRFADAAGAVSDFRAAAQRVVDALPGLNRRWQDAQDAHDSAVGAADRAYDDLRQSVDPRIWRAEESAAGRRRSEARSDAADTRDRAQGTLSGEYDQLIEDLRRAARTCSRAMYDATVSPVSRDAAVTYAATGQNPQLGLGELSPADYLRGTRPLHRDATDVVDQLVSTGVLPAEVRGMDADELDAYLVEHPEVARRLLENHPAGDPGSAAAFLHMTTVPTISTPGTDTAGEQREEVRRFFDSLSEEEQRILAMVYPSVVGHLPGAPFTVRAQANRMKVLVALDDERANLDDLKARDHENENDWDFLGLNNDDLDGAIAKSQRRVDLYESIVGDGRTLVHFDPSGDGAIAELHGDIGPQTSNVGVLVPGTGSDLAGFESNAERTRSFLDEHAAMGREDLAMVTWMGGDLPDDVLTDAPFNHYATDLAPGLASFSHELRQEVESAAGAGATSLTFAGHSYGGSVVGTSETVGLDADRVLHIESAGMGPGVDSPDDVNPTQPDVRRYSMTAEADFIGLTQGTSLGDDIGHGADPDTFPDTTRLDTGNFEDGSLIDGAFDSHSDVFTRRSDAWHNMYDVFTGGEVRLYRPPELVTSGYGPPVQVPYTDPAEEVDIP